MNDRKVSVNEAEPAWCSTHQHRKWCEHTGGAMTDHGWDAPADRKVSVSEADLRWLLDGTHTPEIRERVRAALDALDEKAP